MDNSHARRRIWGWYFFDWASQPYNTLLLTFVFAPYLNDLLGDGTRAQSVWGFGVGAAGIVIALTAPILGAIADTGGARMRFIWVFSIFYILGAAGLWWSEPGNYSLWWIMICFALGLIGMEFATIFTNAMLPDLGPPERIGRISGNGWAFGYLGGLFGLVIMLGFFAEGETGRTFFGISPILGLDPDMREGTRSVGPFTALWYGLFMVPFFLFMRDPRPKAVAPGAVGRALADLRETMRRLPSSPSLFAYLGSSMFYRDALNGMYAFGGIYAAGVLGWTVVEVGTFGILAIVTGAVFSWLGGRADSAYGPKPVIVCSVLILTVVAIGVVFVSREAVFGISVAAGSAIPDVAFYALGAVIGAAGGVLQAASRSMMVVQANPERMTEAFGLYALAGKATSFVAPLSIAVATEVSGSQQLGIAPLIVLFAIGLILLFWVKASPERH
ncbi:MAG: MFS transporter [Pseudomonadota bacterium]